MGAISLSESLKINTTLTKLDLSCKHKGRILCDQFQLLTRMKQSANLIGEKGVTSLSEVLKSNTTLTELNLSCEDKWRHTEDIHKFTLFLFLFT